MSDVDAPVPKASRLPLIAGVVAALGLGGAGFFASYSGFGFGSVFPAGDHAAESMAPVSFVALEPLLVSIGSGGALQNLRFEGNLEVDPAHGKDVAAVMPRIMDVLNSYLRAVELNDLRDPAALIRLRGQMLRRIQMVTGEGQVLDLLVTKFLVS